jgi:hypothetical protein
MAMAVGESGTWSSGEVTPGFKSSLKNRTCDSGDDAKQSQASSAGIGSGFREDEAHR